MFGYESTVSNTGYHWVVLYLNCVCMMFGVVAAKIIRVFGALFDQYGMFSLEQDGAQLGHVTINTFSIYPW